LSLLAVQELTKTFGGNKAVNALTFTVQPGRCVALLGPNGAGKTTTLKMLSGLLLPTSGTINIADGQKGDLRESIGYLPQYPAFFNWMSGLEFLKFTGQLAHLSEKDATHKARELLERVGLKDAAKRRIGGYSGGMKQRLGIAQAVIHEPKLLILDEPVSALDPLGRKEVIDLLSEFKRETTILFSTHVLHDAEEICDDVMIINQGRIVMNGSLKELMTQHQQPVIRIKVSEAQQEWVRGLTNKPYVEECSFNNQTVTIQVKDLYLAREDLLQEIVAQKIEIEGFEIGQTSLEDLFMKAVQQ
jgi:ABC-2 type transport system ATP-binding protein